MLRRECPAWTGFKHRMRTAYTGAEEECLALGNYSDYNKSLKGRFHCGIKIQQMGNSRARGQAIMCKS